MYESELNRILDASRNNALTFFVGAGVSALSGAPTWKGLIDALCNEIDRKTKEEYSSDEYLQIPQMYYYSIDRNEEKYHDFVKARINSTDLHPNRIHQEMLKLNPASFITTNYDTLLEDSATQYCQSYKVIACDEDVPQIYGDRFILKLHGDFNKNNFVLKEEDYLNYSENFKLIETLAKSIFSTNTVVFIGYSLNDYNIKLILNWTKVLLKDSFRNPIFVYVGGDDLSPEDLLYQESKGLSVIDCNKLSSDANNYPSKYRSVFDALRNVSHYSLDGKTDDEGFDILYNLLQPLDRLNALRIEDVSKKLSPHIYIGDNGLIQFSQGNRVIMTRFLEINQMTEEERNNLPKETREKYLCIIRVFRKARITEYVEDHNWRCFVTGEIPLADKHCILFDYNAMNAFSKKEYKSAEKNYQKAFYLSKLKRYDEAFFLFSEVAKNAFRERDYLLYYLAQANCISLRTVIKNTNVWYGCYDIGAIEAVLPSDSDMDNLFRRLPVEFRNTYDTLKDVHSVNMLYKYAYDSFVDGQKLENAIESDTLEFGLSSSGKAMYRINGYLHFLLGNGIIADVFAEYKSAVKYLMSMLVHKYSVQGKTTLRDRPLSFPGNDKVIFDEIDFYCFIECFTAKELIKLFNKYHIDTIKFNNIELIDCAVNNLLYYYEHATLETKNHVDVMGTQVKISSCLALLRYADISQEMVDRMCGFILSHEFADILINDKIMFLDAQLAKRKMISEVTSRIVENTLISYIDKHIAALKNNEKFEVRSTSTGINYYTLVYYIYPEEKKSVSRRLSMRVSQIVSEQISGLYSHVYEHYCAFVSEYQKKRLISWANKQMNESFSISQFAMLLHCNARISTKVKKQLKSFLKNRIDVAQNAESNNVVYTYPPRQPFEELVQVGYWCFINRLKASDYREFLGISDEFDFYCEYSKFDFSRFDVSWLLKVRPFVIGKIAENKDVKEKIRLAIARKLSNDTIVEPDRQQIQQILVRYFC